MRMPLSRTREKLIHQAKSLIFEKANFQKMIDLREKHELEDSMGFRGQWDEHRRFQIEMLKLQGLRPEHRFLELGCGPLTVGVPLIQYLEPGHYTGVDIRNSVLNLCWREIGNSGLSAKNPRLICSSSFASDELQDQQFDFVYSFSVLFIWTMISWTDISRRWREGFFRPEYVLQMSARIYLMIRWLEFPFLNRAVETYVSIARQHGLTTTNHGTLADLGFRSPATEKNNPLLSFRLRA